jgi:hypothetical protein
VQLTVGTDRALVEDGPRRYNPCMCLRLCVAAVASASSVATGVHLYAPFAGGSLAAGIHVRRTASGYCWTTSSADARSDAYRCFVGNVIYDPCFAGTGPAGFVLCPLSGPASPVLRITLTKKLPRGSSTRNPTRYPPWAVQLRSGRWCTILTGATGQIAGLRINYGCAGGGILLGNPRRATRTWTIFAARSLRSRTLTRAAIRSAWW